MRDSNQGGAPVRLGLIGEILNNARLAWRLLTDGRVSKLTKLLLPGLALGYLLLPADLMPDFLPVLGQMDDIAVLALGMKFFIDRCPPGIVQQHRDDLAGGRPSGASTRDGGVVDAEYRVID